MKLKYLIAALLYCSAVHAQNEPSECILKSIQTDLKGYNLRGSVEELVEKKWSAEMKFGEPTPTKLDHSVKRLFNKSGNQTSFQFNDDVPTIYSYDNNGHLQMESDEDESRVYEYFSNGLLKSVSDFDENKKLTKKIIYTYSGCKSTGSYYDENGNLTDKSTTEYNKDGLQISYTSGGDKLTYSYNEKKQLIRTVGVIGNQKRDAKVQYTPQGDEMAGGKDKIVYTYDANGNWIKKVFYTTDLTWGAAVVGITERIIKYY